MDRDTPECLNTDSFRSGLDTYRSGLDSNRSGLNSLLKIGFAGTSKYTKVLYTHEQTNERKEGETDILLYTEAKECRHSSTLEYLISEQT